MYCWQHCNDIEHQESFVKPTVFTERLYFAFTCLNGFILISQHINCRKHYKFWAIIYFMHLHSRPKYQKDRLIKIRSYFDSAAKLVLEFVNPCWIVPTVPCLALSETQSVCVRCR